MNIVTPFNVLLFVLNTNALPYQSSNGIGHFDQDVDGIDTKSPIERVGRDRAIQIHGVIPISRMEDGKNFRFALG